MLIALITSVRTKPRNRAHSCSLEEGRQQKIRLWNDLYCVGWGSKLCSLTRATKKCKM